MPLSLREQSLLPPGEGKDEGIKIKYFALVLIILAPSPLQQEREFIA
jgi:hypothetical protein